MMADASRLAGKVALVTGGGRGIGRGIALALAREGADIAIADVETLPSAHQQYRSTAVGGYQAALAAVEEVRSLGRKAIAVEADVTQWPQVQRMVAEAVERLGSLDILVNNAGVGLRAAARRR